MNHGFSFILFIIRRIIVIIEHVNMWKTDANQENSRKEPLFKKVWINKEFYLKLSTSYLIFFLIASISKRKLSSVSSMDLIFPWA